MGTILTISGIKKQFGGMVVLDGIDMDVEAGKIYQMIGPNGSGKTTLINVISGLLKPDEGTITFDGTDITQKGPFETFKMGLVRTWQIPQPFRNLTTMENFMVASGKNRGERFLAAPIRSIWRRDEEQVAHRSAEIMEVVNLIKKKELQSQNLSGGQQKLLELGRAMMSDTKMILMDEPIAGVNPTLAYEIFEKIKKICKEQKITFLIIEHRLDISLQYAERVFVLNGGKIIAEDGPDEVVKDPKVIESYLGE